MGVFPPNPAGKARGACVVPAPGPLLGPGGEAGAAPGAVQAVGLVGAVGRHAGLDGFGSDVGQGGAAGNQLAQQHQHRQQPWQGEAEVKVCWAPRAGQCCRDGAGGWHLPGQDVGQTPPRALQAPAPLLQGGNRRDPALPVPQQLEAPALLCWDRAGCRGCQRCPREWGCPRCFPGHCGAGAAVYREGAARLCHIWGTLTCRAATCHALQPWMAR